MRSFLALEIPQDIVAYLGSVADRLAKRTEGVKWVRNEGIHITVKFLGEIEEAMAERVRDVLAPVGRRYAPIQARLGQLGAFPSSKSARVIVVKLKEGIESTQAIFADVEEGLERIHVEREKRELVPHITLGRRRIPKPFPNGDPMPIEEKAFVIENLVLVKSTLTPGGAIYTPIWKIKLGGEER
jgi:RNA 2',3'-cyclic 3'-phosphodiesterase